MSQHRELVRSLLLFSVTLTEPSDAKERQNPSLGSTVELGFLGSVLHVELPLGSDSQQLSETSTFGERFDPAVHVSTPHLTFTWTFRLTYSPWMCSSSHPLHRSTRHQYSSLKHRWQTYGRCGNAWCCVSRSWSLDHRPR